MSNRKAVVVFGLLLLMATGCKKQEPTSTATKTHPAAENAALASAQTWLATVDGANYSKGWDETSPSLKVAAGKADFDKSLRGARTPLGTLVSRAVKSKQYATSLPGAPDGEYVVIQFDTTFQNKAHAVETVTPKLDSDGQWRVSGYYIK